ncbi:hypothetical protein G9A89_020930 [Geosiphon pyriformis]|nr:hypothetical protein G9A89_020930 [Geosiphon pyriformis]
MTSVASRNLFDLLDDEAEDVDIIVEDKQETNETIAAKPKVDRSRASRTEARIRHEYPQRGGFKATIGPNAAHSTRTDQEARSVPRDRNVGPRLSVRRDRGEEGGANEFPARTPRGARAGERSRGSLRGNRRGHEFDRHSGTGRNDSEKKETRGWGDATNSYNEKNEPENWTNEENTDGNSSSWQTGDTNTSATVKGSGEIVADTANATSWGSTDEIAPDAAEPSSNWKTDDPSEEEPAKWNEPKIDEEAPKESVTAESVPPINEEEQQKTLEEYLAEKAQKALNISLPEIRKPNEGIENEQWKDAVPLQKEDDEDYLFTGKEQSIKLKAKRSLKAKTLLDIDQTFVERPGGGFQRGRGRGRGGRGGRGGGRDSREGGGGDHFRERRDERREDRREGWNADNRRGGGGRNAVNLDDVSDFPSLGSS